MNNISLTDRDHAILTDCYKNTVMSFAQLQKRHFKENSKATVHNRLSQLLQRGYVTKARVGALAHPGGIHNVGVVYQIGRNGIRALKKLYPNEEFRRDPLRMGLPGLPHELLLNEVIWAFEIRYPITTFCHGRLLQDCGAKRIPDAVLELGSEKIAIELELTAKSEKRYREIVLQYLLTPAFTKVIYITANNRIQEKIETQITGRKAIPGLPKPSTGKFYFIELSSLLKYPDTAAITNGEEDLTNEVQS